MTGVSFIAALSLSLSATPQNFPNPETWGYETSAGGAQIYAEKFSGPHELSRLLAVVYDYGEKGEQGDLSSLYVYQSDCANGMLRTISYRYFDGPMGTGQSLRQGVSAELRRPEPVSVAGWFLKLICETDLTPKEKILNNWRFLQTE
jgi:hypothetical protein